MLRKIFKIEQFKPGFLCLFVLVLVTCVFIKPVFAISFAGGDGSTSTPYQIATCEQLQEIGSSSDVYLDKKFILSNDIDCSMTNPNDGDWDGGGTWGDGAGFVPIGNIGNLSNFPGSDNPFIGVFNGDNKKITGLYINRPFTNGQIVGLFGYAKNAIIKNVGIVGAEIIGEYKTATYNLGVLAGIIEGTVINNSYSTGTVSVATPRPVTYYIKKLEDGIFEEAYQKSFSVDFTTKDFVFSGLANSLTLEINQKGRLPFAGVDAIILKACGTEIIPSSAFYSDNKKDVLDDVLEIDNNVIISHERPIQISWQLPLGCTTAVMSLTANEYGPALPFKFPVFGLEKYKLVSDNSVLIVDGIINEVDETQASYSPYWESTTGHPADNVFIYAKDDKDYLYFAADITIDNTDDYGSDWFAATVNGKKFLVNDFDNTYGNCGFGRTSRVSYKHQTCELKIPKNLINIQGDYVSFVLEYYGTGGLTPQGMGGLVGAMINSSEISSSSYSSVVVNDSGTGGALKKLGGLVGYVSDSVINRAWATGQVISGGEEYIGGLVGRGINITISKSYAAGAVSGGDNHVGGLIGQSTNSGDISESYASGEVTGSGNYIGGLIGNNYSGHVENVYSTGDVNGGVYVGGLIGISSNAPTVINSYASGDVTADNYVGGLIGWLEVENVFNSFSIGTVVNNGVGSFGGGLIGVIKHSNGEDYLDYIYNSGWLTTSAENAIGATTEDGVSFGAAVNSINYNETTKHFFYASTSNIYTINFSSPETVSKWAFVSTPIWDANIGLLPTLNAIAADDKTIQYYTLTYSAGNGGSISGSSTQVLANNLIGSVVSAVANSGYRFVRWSENNSTSSSRSDEAVSNNSFTAIFELIPSSGGAVFSLPSGVGLGIMDKTIGMGQSGSLGIITVKGINYLSYINSNASFNILTSKDNNPQNHNLIINNLDLFNNIVQFTIQSAPQTFKLKIGDIVQIDLDGDKVDDVEIKFINVWINRVELTIKSLFGIKGVMANFEAGGEDLKKEEKAKIVKYFFGKNLYLGLIDLEVKELQKYLNTNGFFVKKSGPGSLGNEIFNFGPATRAAVVAFQKANRIFPAAGYFGQLSRKFINGNFKN